MNVESSKPAAGENESENPHDGALWLEGLRDDDEDGGADCSSPKASSKAASVVGALSIAVEVAGSVASEADRGDGTVGISESQPSPVLNANVTSRSSSSSSSPPSLALVHPACGLDAFRVRPGQRWVCSVLIICASGEVS